MGLASSAHYTQQDIQKYDYYTPDILKNMPRISARYEFDYANISGPASAFIFTIKFYGTRETDKINLYLDSTGYKKQATCFVEAVCWQGHDPKEVITVGDSSDPDTVAVSVIQR